MKISNEDFTIETTKVDNDKNICLLGDLHIRPNTSYRFLNMILEKINSDSYDFIVFDGDFVYSPDDFSDPKCNAKIKDLLRELSFISPVFIVPGNHDIKNEKEGTDYLKSLESISNVKLLLNEQLTYNGINITGFNPSIKVYYYKYKDNWFIYYVNDFVNCLFNFYKESYNVFITHSPQIVGEDLIVNYLSKWYENIDLILCAHMHDGFIPKPLQSKIIGSKGLEFSDSDSILESRIGINSNCRGMHSIENAKIIITRGLRKYVLRSRIFDIVDDEVSHDITSIKLTRKL